LRKPKLSTGKYSAWNKKKTAATGSCVDLNYQIRINKQEHLICLSLVVAYITMDEL
jgi:hypothetical protein